MAETVFVLEELFDKAKTAVPTTIKITNIDNTISWNFDMLWFFKDYSIMMVARIKVLIKYPSCFLE